MTEFTWTPSDDAQAAISGYGPEEPIFTAQAFLYGLGNPVPPEDLAVTVTPESLDSWGDFTAAKEGLESIGEWGMGSYPEPAEGAADVAYVKILANVPEAYQVEFKTAVRPAAWITLVWRPERGLWLVHAFGQPLAPEALPRTSPGVAPQYTRAT